jgi:hypothetical protein
MSRIDDALTRAAGKPGHTPKSSLFRRFVSESGVGRRVQVRHDDRHTPSMSAAARQALADRSAQTRATSRGEPDLDPTDRIFGLPQIVHSAGFVVRAVFRHKLLVVFSFLLTFSMIVVATKLAPRTYEIEVKLLAQRNAIMQSLSNPGRVVPYEADSPTRAAAETVLRRDNVLSLIRQTDLINEWDRTRAPILKLYDRVKATIRRREPTLDEKLDALVTEIENRMVVSAAASMDGQVSIYLQWPDAHSGFVLVEKAQQAFLDARQVEETRMIADVIAMLQKYGDNLTKDIRTTLAELTRTQARVLAELPAPRLPSTTGSVVARVLDAPNPADAPAEYDEVMIDPAALSDPRLGRLKGEINGKRLELVRLQYEQKRKLDELQAQLSVARTIYTPNHPTVQTLQQSVAAFQHNSPQITMLRRQVEQLEDEADQFAAMAAARLIQTEMSRRSAAPPVPRPAPVPMAPVTLAPAPVAPVADEGLPRRAAVADYATMRLRIELNQLQGILQRTDAARIEHAVSQAAFKRRYTVISPASEPGDETFPNTRRILLAGFMASVLFALFIAIAVDVLSNRILEPWQVQRQLGLPVLGTARLS